MLFYFFIAEIYYLPYQLNYIHILHVQALVLLTGKDYLYFGPFRHFEGGKQMS